MYWGNRCPICERSLVRQGESETCPQGHYTRGSFPQPTQSELFGNLGFNRVSQKWDQAKWREGWEA